MSTIYLVKRGPRPAYWLAPFHPVVICGKRRVAKWEAGWTGDAAWVWSHERSTLGGGWLLERWNGFDIDYGHVVRGVTMPDGTDGAFVHEHTGREPWPLISGAVWYDDKPVPSALRDRGVVYPPDKHSQQQLLDFIADDGAGGFGRERPTFWPEPEPLVTWEVADKIRIPNGARVAYTEGIGCDAKPAEGVIVALTATLERPNGRYQDAYTIRRDDGTDTTRYRDHLESLNSAKVSA